MAVWADTLHKVSGRWCVQSLLKSFEKFDKHGRQAGISLYSLFIGRPVFDINVDISYVLIGSHDLLGLHKLP